MSASTTCRRGACASPPLSPAEVSELARQVPQWHVGPDGKSIRREWRVKDFPTALDFFNRIGAIAEGEDHHPDLHLTGLQRRLHPVLSHLDLIR